jgi:hypothetical protein
VTRRPRGICGTGGIIKLGSSDSKGKTRLRKGKDGKLLQYLATILIGRKDRVHIQVHSDIDPNVMLTSLLPVVVAGRKTPLSSAATFKCEPLLAVGHMDDSPTNRGSTEKPSRSCTQKPRTISAWTLGLGSSTSDYVYTRLPQAGIPALSG